MKGCFDNMKRFDNHIIKMCNIFHKRDAFLQSIQKELNIRLDGDNIISDIPDIFGIEDNKHGKEK